MFLTLLFVTFVAAACVSTVVGLVFRKPVQRILHRIMADEISSAWQRYLMFALYVVGIASGVRVWELEKYVTKPYEAAGIIELSRDRWILEVYRTIIETLEGLAWVLLVFFIATLIAFVIVRIFELRKARDEPPKAVQPSE